MGELVRELTPSRGLLIVDLTRLMAVLAREVAADVTLAAEEPPIDSLVPCRPIKPVRPDDDIELFMAPEVRRIWLAGERLTLCTGAKRP